MHSPWLILLPLGGAVWSLLGFPPGWGWLVLPMVPTRPISLGMVVVLAGIVIGGYAALAWLRTNI